MAIEAVIREREIEGGEKLKERFLSSTLHLQS